MKTLIALRHDIISALASILGISRDRLDKVDVTLNVDKGSEFGDVSCNAALVLSKITQTAPKDLANKLKTELLERAKTEKPLSSISSIEIAGPGFLNITFDKKLWGTICQELLDTPEADCQIADSEKKRYLVEFVSANPTGPLHLAHGRNAIIGDVLCRVLKFVGHDVTREFYINDAGNQMHRLGRSLQALYRELEGAGADFPEDGYKGQYLKDVAQELKNEFGAEILEEPVEYFINYGYKKMLNLIKSDLQLYGVSFDNWVSERSLYDNGDLKKSIQALTDKGFTYEADGALWFKSSEFGDEKDRVLVKETGEPTYIAPDIAYHQTKFDRGYDHILDIMGQDHHGYVTRLKATMQALGNDASKLDVILYQMVHIKKGDVFVRMSKRAGNFETLASVIEIVGKDVARYFYLNRKAEAHLEFDLDVALKKSEENPVYYIQYAFVRTFAILEKAEKEAIFENFVMHLRSKKLNANNFVFENDEIALIKKIVSLESILKTIASTYHTHMLAFYTFELAKQFHSFYAHNRVIDAADTARSEHRLALTMMVRQTLQICLDLMGLDQPQQM